MSSTLTPWQGVRNLLLVVFLALAAAATVAIYAEGNYVRPLCQAYGREHQLEYLGFQYPPTIPFGLSQARTSCYCLFSDGSPSMVDVDFARVAPSYVMYRLVDIALTLGLTIPIFFVLFALGLWQVYGALGIKLRRAASQG